MPLSVKDGMGAWIKDFQDSNAPQFKGKSDKERREMAIAAYMSAKKGDDSTDEGFVSAAQRRAVWANKADDGKGHPDNKKKSKKESTQYLMRHSVNGKQYLVSENYVERMQSVGYTILEKTENLPFDPDPKKPASKNSDGSTTKPMSRAKQIAQLAMRNRKTKTEATVDTADIASKKAMKKSDTEKLGKLADMLAKERKPQKESVELEEMKANAAYTKAAKDIKAYAAKSGGIDKKDMMNFAADLDLMGRAPNILQAGRVLDRINKRFKGYDTDVRDRLSMYLKKHGLMEGTQLDELSPATHKSYQAKAFTSGAKGMAAKRMGTMSAKDAYDNEKKRHDGIELSKSLQRRDARKKRNEEVEEATYGTQAQRMMSPLQKIRQDKEKADRDRGGKLKSTALPMRKKEEVEEAYKTSAEADAYNTGKKAVAKRVSYDNNPHKKGSKEHTAWSRGHNDARANMIAKRYAKEEVEEAGSPERYKMIKKAGDKYNKEKKKAERDAMKAMSKDKDMMGEAKLDSFTHPDDHPLTSKNDRGGPGHKLNFSDKDIMRKLKRTMSDHEKKHMRGAYRDDSAIVHGKTGSTMSSIVGKTARQVRKEVQAHIAKHHPENKTNEENVQELKKSTLGSYVKKAAQDAGAKAYSAAQKATSNPDQSGKDYVKSVKRQKGIAKATDKLTNEAKSFDQKFRDHLKFATSKSPAVQSYLKKRRADRDAMNKKNDPNAAKKGYALSAVPPERKNVKLRKQKQKQQ